MGRHTRSARGRRMGISLPWLPLIAAAVIGGLVIFLAIRGDGSSSTSARANISSSCDDILSVRVAAAPAIAPAVEKLVEEIPSQTCAEFTVEVTEPAQVLATGRTDAPDLWIPDSIAWVNLWQERFGLGSATTNGSMAISPLLWAMPTDDVRALGGPGQAVPWETLFAHPAKHQLADPNISTPSMITSVHARKLLRENPLAPTTSGLPWRRMIGTASGSTAEQLDTFTEQRSSFPVAEYQLASYLAANDTSDLSAVLPSSGAGMLDFPVATLRGDARYRAAAQSLYDRAATDKGGEILNEVYLRRSVTDPTPETLGFTIPPETLLGRESYGGAAVKAALASYEELRRPNDVIFAVDRSGSMSAPSGDGTRAQVAAAAVSTVVDAISDRNGAGYWEFSTALEGNTDHVVMVDLEELGSTIDGQSQRDRIKGTATELPSRLGGGTGLYDTAIAGMEALSSGDPGRTRTLLIITDGFNDDSTGGASLADAAARIAELHAQTDTKLLVIGMGNDVEKDALSLLASSGGGAFISVSDSEDLFTMIATAFLRAP